MCSIASCGTWHTRFSGEYAFVTPHMCTCATDWGGARGVKRGANECQRGANEGSVAGGGGKRGRNFGIAADSLLQV